MHAIEERRIMPISGGSRKRNIGDFGAVSCPEPEPLTRPSVTFSRREREGRSPELFGKPYQSSSKT